ncbi:MAG TPA: hypothetical protein VGO11_17390 [Chthoniobacteraceae bacterium]|jgi:hypothetical protein|nr:hypothetical protein [Chthoniobacteraceae bacterium]
MTTSCTHDVSLHDQDSDWPAGAPPRTAAGHAHPEPADANPEGAEAPGAGRGRPSTCTPAKLQAICSFIRLTGLSDTAAAAMAGVKRSTLARWKKEDEDVEMELDQARFQYQAPRLAKIDETRMKDGQHDWRAQAWLVKFANPEVYGAPSRRRKLRDVEVEAPLTPEEQRAQEEAAGRTAMEQEVRDFKGLHPGIVITPAILALLQQRRAIVYREWQEKEEAEKAAAVGAGFTEGSERREEGAGANAAFAFREAQGSHDSHGVHTPPAAAGAAKNVTIRPEIPGLYRYPMRRVEAMAG